MTNSSSSPVDPKGKETPYMPFICSNYWPPIMASFVSLISATFDLLQNLAMQVSNTPEIYQH